MYSVFIVLMLLLLPLQAQELAPEEVMQLHQYNHKPSLKLKQQRLLQQLAHISKTEAYTLAQEVCDSNIDNSRLQHHNKRLFYTLNTKNCTVQIDALDGSILRQKGN